MKEFKTKGGNTLPILNLRGKDYLQVAYRLVWFREDHPDWSIETDVVGSGPDWTFFKAIIKNPSGQIISTGHKYEDQKGFPDHREKAETGSIGRALALCGYGTQFCGEELDEGKRLADAPLGKQNPIVSDQPLPGDGHPHDGPYRISFGKFKSKGLKEIDIQDLRNYVNYLETQAEKKKVPITGQVLDFITRATEHIISIENGHLDTTIAEMEPGSNG